MFKKGISGNLNGRPKGSTSRHKLTESMLAKFNEDEIFEVLASLRKAAIDGEIGAAKTFLEFFMVKADKMAEIEAQSQGDEPLNISVKFVGKARDGEKKAFDSHEDYSRAKTSGEVSHFTE